ncbi:MAG: hypothetical protein NZ959_09440 [Armatimonadetes bacterium]|nr:hypothetical protein [Armatimonadota bacterium]MDW8122190.1 hypothetical protein [Armatimonadota bacterium]
MTATGNRSGLPLWTVVVVIIVAVVVLGALLWRTRGSSAPPQVPQEVLEKLKGQPVAPVPGRPSRPPSR